MGVNLSQPVHGNTNQSHFFSSEGLKKTAVLTAKIALVAAISFSCLGGGVALGTLAYSFLATDISAFLMFGGIGSGLIFTGLMNPIIGTSLIDCERSKEESLEGLSIYSYTKNNGEDALYFLGSSFALAGLSVTVGMVASMVFLPLLA